MAFSHPVCACRSLECPGGCDDREEPEMGVCRVCGADFDGWDGLADGPTFCGSHLCRVASGRWLGVSEEERAEAWRTIIRAAVARERRAFSPTNIRAIIRDCKADLAVPANPAVKEALARETADWYARLYRAEDTPIRRTIHA
jgi:hypothetical protein